MLKTILNFVFYTILMIAGITCAIVAVYVESKDIGACFLFLSVITIIGGFIGYMLSSNNE